MGVIAGTLMRRAVVVVVEMALEMAVAVEVVVVAVVVVAVDDVLNPCVYHNWLVNIIVIDDEFCLSSFFNFFFFFGEIFLLYVLHNRQGR